MGLLLTTIRSLDVAILPCVKILNLSRRQCLGFCTFSAARQMKVACRIHNDTLPLCSVQPNQSCIKFKYKVHLNWDQELKLTANNWEKKTWTLKVDTELMKLTRALARSHSEQTLKNKRQKRLHNILRSDVVDALALKLRLLVRDQTVLTRTRAVVCY